MAQEDGDPREDRQFVTSLARGLSLLSAFGPNDRSLSNQELAERTGLPRPTVSRLAHTLMRLDYLTYHKRLGRFSLSPRVIELGQSAQLSTGLREIARPALTALSEMGDISVALGIPGNYMIKYIDLVRRPEAIVLNLDVGAEIPIPQTAIGRAYLAALAPAERTAAADRLRNHDPDTWQAHAARVDAAATDLEQMGYTASYGEWRPELNAIATAFRISPEGQPVLLSVAGLSSILTRDMAESFYAPALLNTARSIETRLRALYLS